jgi:hypothetical protein
VTDKLQFRNEAAVEVAAPADAPLGEVAVEVRSGTSGGPRPEPRSGGGH